MLWVLLASAFVVPAKAGPVANLPDDWFTRVPAPGRIEAVTKAAAAEGWPAVADRLFVGSIKAYELRQEEAAAAWYHVARWCDLFGQSQKAEGRRWLGRLSAAGLPDKGFDQAKVLARADAPVADLLTEETRTWLLSDRAFSEAFFNLLTPCDDVSRVVQILQTLRLADARRFTEYAQLALAIAVVYDVPPPSGWPHWQVSETALPRRLPDPLEAFVFLTKADRSRVTLHRLDQLSAGELKFLVDMAAPFAELEWAQRSVKFPLADLAKSYESVGYRLDRIKEKCYVWPGKTYALQEILNEGGICVDQAYYATQAGKARGVPTLLFGGAGRDGHHAWFGYLGPGRQWVLDAGRYAEQRFVTGETMDPQTWQVLSDHELSFLSEGFRRLAPYRQSWQHQVFAELYLVAGNKTAAAAAARKAVSCERRNLAAWELLISAGEDAPVLAREAVLREAAQAMQRYPDLAGRFIHGLAASLRKRGEASAAEFEERSLARRGQSSGRTDVGVEEAARIMAGVASAELVKSYKQVSEQYGRGAGIDFYDRVARPLLERMLKENRKAEARQIVAQTRAVLNPRSGSPLDDELNEIAAKAR